MEMEIGREEKRPVRSDKDRERKVGQRDIYSMTLPTYL